jgi:tRNA(adenine34) deaminase
VGCVSVPPVLDTDAMRLALDEANRAGSRGEVPVGAVVVAEGRVVAGAGNQREQTGDPTAHAEMVALRSAAADAGRWRLTGSTVYCTLEPCPMCAGALVASRVSRLVFGTADPKAGACGSLYNLCADPRLNHELEVLPGVLEEECAGVLRRWFADRRAASEAPGG